MSTTLINKRLNANNQIERELESNRQE